MRLSLLCVALAVGLMASACQPVRPEAPATAPAAAQAPAVPADDNLNAVLWVQRSAEYRAAAAQAYRAATDHLDVALKQADWDALVPEERGNAARGLKPAVVLDIDETVLDNSPYQARLVRDGAEYSDPTWDAWVEERKAKALPGVVEFARAANARGITLVYISNRAVHLKQATLDNLRAEGLPVADEGVFLGLGTVVEGCEQDGSEKDCRRQLAGRTYRVLMQFGDQLGDFARIQDNSPAGRQALLDRYDGWFGERWWMLPNPTYGSWEPALFDNDWRQPRDVRRAAKRAALDVAP
ncbi:5'-nucleotidase, lipoprotein e(P4) family [Pseudoxanthomonas daejeonensis]|uniref:5'-nucleotidase, lipoprotein e(P4) family n=1 Tax=Pseudoxanthomonas daejeonensis TaxID=266062 RepID=A0ABQ6Z6S0_9GAMM|nr:5'-nucleotidase, lipoprotein e(P4) family [Pseudoxanthomonas daejeonensis]KAF1694414.1 5'-nucleotidase, lipoprotein e(P4) family [Pseudoxanthomonas daejeonensis]UNK58875.1 5'-nucleotidase, lipoprotein e(P4) family [Pseudoxanthomonas daejeonensis]